MTPSPTTISIVVAVSASFGILGALFVIVSFCMFRTLSHHRQRLVLWLSIADFFDSCAWFLSPFVVEDDHLCTTQASLIQMFGFAGLFWMLFLAVHLIRVAFSNLRPGSSLRVFWWESVYHVIAWGFPSFMTAYLYEHNEFGPAGPHHCWIKGDQNPARIYFGYGILFFVFMFNVVASFLVIRRMTIEIKVLPQSSTRGNLEARHKVQRRLLAFIVVFGFCWVWGLVNRILGYVNPSLQQDWLFYMQAIFEPSTPLLNAVVFGYSEKLKMMYVDKISYCLGRKQRYDRNSANVGIRKLENTVRRVEISNGVCADEFGIPLLESPPDQLCPLRDAET
eukprot:ANDGO_02199.mRNA.1 Cyclic AMP receptor-like protein A